jgi:hypothetical protein
MLRCLPTSQSLGVSSPHEPRPRSSKHYELTQVSLQSLSKAAERLHTSLAFLQASKLPLTLALPPQLSQLCLLTQESLQSPRKVAGR